MKIWAEISAHRSFHAWILIPSAINESKILGGIFLCQNMFFYPIQDGPFGDCFGWIGVGLKDPLPHPSCPCNLSHTHCQASYNDETWHSYTLVKEDTKIYFESRGIITVYYRKLPIFVLSGNTDKTCILIQKFSFFNFFES